MNSIGSQHPSLLKLVVTHYLVSAICFVALAIMLLLSADAFSGHYFQPKLLAITHTAALGWATLIIFGACYQLLPVILETELFSYKLGWISLLSFVIGLILLVSSFWSFEPGLCMQVGSLLLISGILLFVLNTFFTAKHAKKTSTHQDFIVTACIWLLATAILGSLMVYNFQYAFLPQDHLLFLKLHAHMGIVGWFLLLIIGVSSKLIPMFLVSTQLKTVYLSRCYYLINSALILFLVDTYLNELTIKTYIIATVGLVGIFYWLAYVFWCFKSRMHKVLDTAIWHTLLSISLLTAAIVVLPFIIFYQLQQNSIAISYTNLYGSLIFMGWITALILGQTFKTLPFIIWIKHYQHIAGTGIIPMPADLFKKTLLKVQFASFITFNVCFYTGLILHSQTLIKAGLACFLLTALLYMANVMVIVLHKTKSTKYATI